MSTVVVFDIDGVLADFSYGFSSLAVNRGWMDRPNFNEEILTWSLSPDTLTSGQVNEIWREIDHSNIFWRNLPPLFPQHHIQQLHALKEEFDLEFWYVTGRSEGKDNQTREQTLYWLWQYRLPDSENLIMSNDKPGVLGDLRADHEIVSIIEDNPKNIKDLRIHNWPVVQMVYPYNEIATHVDVPRVHSLGEYINMLREVLDG